MLNAECCMLLMHRSHFRIEVRVFQLESGCVLVSLRERQELGFAIKLTEKREAYRSAGSAYAVIIAIVFRRRFGCVWAAEAVGQNYRRMSSEIRCDQLFAGGRRNDYVEIFEQFPPEFHRFHTRAIRLDVLDRRSET